MLLQGQSAWLQVQDSAAFLHAVMNGYVEVVGEGTVDHHRSPGESRLRPCTQVLGRLEVSMSQQRAAAEGCLAMMLHSKRSIRKDERPIPSSSPGAAHMASTGIPSEGHRQREHRPLPFSYCLRSTMHSLPQDMLEKAIAGRGEPQYDKMASSKPRR